MHVLLEPFDYAFLRHALVACTIAGALCGLLGVYVTLRSMSYLGHGLSHAIFGGAAACAAVGLNLFVGAGVWGLGSGLAVSRITRRRIIGGDAAIGVVTTASFAFGIALLGLYSRVRRSIDATIFGSVLGVSTTDVWVLVGVTVVAVAVVVACYRPLLFVTFDPEVAAVTGVPVARYDAVLMALMSLAILACMKVLGVTLIAAAIVIPPVVARLLASSFARVLVLSTVIGAAGGLTGMYLSYHLDISSGASIVLTDFAVFAVVFAATGWRHLDRLGAPDPTAAAGPALSVVPGREPVPTT